MAAVLQQLLPKNKALIRMEKGHGVDGYDLVVRMMLVLMAGCVTGTLTEGGDAD